MFLYVATTSTETQGFVVVIVWTSTIYIYSSNQRLSWLGL